MKHQRRTGRRKRGRLAKTASLKQGPVLDPEEALRRLEDPKIRKRFNTALKGWDKKFAAEIEAIRRAERITEEDLAIIVH